MPTNLRVGGLSTTSMTLDFTASTDNVNVTGYDLFRNGAKVWMLTDGTTSLTYGGLACGTSYTLGVNAFDAAGNHSAIASTSATTLACPTTTPSPTTTTTTTTTTSTTTPISGTVLYAKRWEDGLTDSEGWTHQGADSFSTNPFNGIFYGSIGPDNTTGDTGSWSGRFSLPANTTNMQGAMMLHFRTVKNGEDNWFGMAYYFPTGWPESLQRPSAPQETSLNVGCPNYYSVNSCMVSVAARPDSMFTLINSGACPASGVAPGCPWYSASPDGGNYSTCRGFTGSQCGPHYIIPPGQLTLNVWHEIIMHVYYTTGNNGVVEFWHRIKGQTTWQKTVSVSGGFPTLQTGPTAFGTTVTPTNIDGWQSTDQFGMYRWPSVSAATVRADTWCRATTFDAAASCFR